MGTGSYCAAPHRSVAATFSPMRSDGLQVNSVDVRAARLLRQAGHTRTSVVHRRHHICGCMPTCTAEMLACGPVPARTAGLPAIPARISRHGGHTPQKKAHGRQAGRPDGDGARLGYQSVVLGREWRVARPLAPHSGHELGGIGPQADTTVPSDQHTPPLGPRAPRRPAPWRQSA